MPCILPPGCRQLALCPNRFLKGSLSSCGPSPRSSLSTQHYYPQVPMPSPSSSSRYAHLHLPIHRRPNVFTGPDGTTTGTLPPRGPHNYWHRGRRDNGVRDGVGNCAGTQRRCLEGECAENETRTQRGARGRGFSGGDSVGQVWDVRQAGTSRSSILLCDSIFTGRDLPCTGKAAFWAIWRARAPR
jgi:hypothetical protein